MPPPIQENPSHRLHTGETKLSQTEAQRPLRDTESRGSPGGPVTVASHLISLTVVISRTRFTSSWEDHIFSLQNLNTKGKELKWLNDDQN